MLLVIVQRHGDAADNAVAANDGRQDVYKRQLEGSIVALVTPFKKDGSVDFDALERLIDFHLQNGTDAILSLIHIWLKALGVLLLCMIVIVAVANATGVVDLSLIHI